MNAKPTHSRIGASSMHRWSRCPGSVALIPSQDSLPSTSIYAEEGTRAHEFAAEYLLKGNWNPNTPNEMKAHIEVYADSVWEAVNESPASVYIEQKFDLSKLHEGLYGTADAVLYHHELKLLRVFDFKYGAGLPVEVIDEEGPNEQLMYYGLGALLSTGMPADEVELIIVQPRCPHPDGPVRRHRFPAINLIDFSSDLVEAAIRTTYKDAPLIPGDHCKFCPASGICPKLHEKAVEVAKEEFSPALSYDPKKLAETLNWLPALEGYIKSVREFAYREAQHGRTPPGWKVVAKRAIRKWNDSVKAWKVLKEDFDLPEDEILESKMKSPAQVEKLIPKHLKNEFKELVTAVSSGVTLVPESDRRPAVQSTAKLDFMDAINAEDGER
ncbi:DUF2800 domain-containing protein [Candidatus Dojkabacteria bacterium]|uniref:DUF2800 domain-containing protein n=1 Tax=Candidatus Dojkabacteria bacterium TaxID=2099670 RepID=A0A5C7J7T8_9BACT|nr:MAG: DUF2800 domain-containing protein [Candidatus Dojkabacteria bacterium]